MRDVVRVASVRTCGAGAAECLKDKVVDLGVGANLSTASQCDVAIAGWMVRLLEDFAPMAPQMCLTTNDNFGHSIETAHPTQTGHFQIALKSSYRAPLFMLAGRIHRQPSFCLLRWLG